MTRGAAVTAAAAVWPTNATASAAAASMPIAVRTKITLRPHMALFRLPGLPVDKVPPVVPDNQNPKGPLEPGATRPKSASPLHLGRAQSTITPDPVTHIPARAIGHIKRDNQATLRTRSSLRARVEHTISPPILRPRDPRSNAAVGYAIGRGVDVSVLPGGAVDAPWLGSGRAVTAGLDQVCLCQL